MASTTPAVAWDWSPAGHDVRLARAISGLETPGFAFTKDLLSYLRARRSIASDRRTYCTNVLSALIARRHLPVAEQWAADEPDNADALVLLARVRVREAIFALRDRSEHAPLRFKRAVQACEAAAAVAPEDPVPWVALLSLCEADGDQARFRFGWGREGLDVVAPWSLFEEITRRSPYNREAFHRFIGCVAGPGPSSMATGLRGEEKLAGYAQATRTAKAQVAVWAANSAPDGSPLKLLALIHAADQDPFPNPAEAVRLQNYLTANPRGRDAYLTEREQVLREVWQRRRVEDAIAQADTWFSDTPSRPYLAPADVSFLAWYLHRADEQKVCRGISRRALMAARRALEWMIPHATTTPWNRDGPADEVLAKVCQDCGIHAWQLPR